MRLKTEESLREKYQEIAGERHTRFLILGRLILVIREVVYTLSKKKQKNEVLLLCLLAFWILFVLFDGIPFYTRDSSFALLLLQETSSGKVLIKRLEEHIPKLYLVQTKFSTSHEN